MNIVEEERKRATNEGHKFQEFITLEFGKPLMKIMLVDDHVIKFKNC